MTCDICNRDTYSVNKYNLIEKETNDKLEEICLCNDCINSFLEEMCDINKVKLERVEE